MKKKSGEPTSEAAVRYHLRIIYKDLGISDLGDDEKEDLLEGEIYNELEKIVEEILKKEDLKNYDDALKYFPYPVLGKEKDLTHEVMEDVLGKKEEEEEKPTIPPHPYSDYNDVVNKTEEIQEEDNSTNSDPATEDLEVTPPLEEPSEETPQGDEDLGDDEPSEPEEDEERIR